MRCRANGLASLGRYTGDAGNYHSLYFCDSFNSYSAHSSQPQQMPQHPCTSKTTNTKAGRETLLKKA